jgi:hypothetical protein
MQTFWQFLYMLQHEQYNQGIAIVNGAVIYGGNVLQAFLTALDYHGVFRVLGGY